MQTNIKITRVSVRLKKRWKERIENDMIIANVSKI